MSLDLTTLQEARAMLSEVPQEQFEQRLNQTQIVPALFAGNDFIPNLAAIKEAETQVTKIEYLEKASPTLITEKSCTITGETGSSGIATVTWSQLGFAIKTAAKVHQGNDYKAAVVLKNDLIQFEGEFWTGSTGMDALALAWLETNRTKVNALSGYANAKNTWVGATDYHTEVLNANRNYFYDYATADMHLNKYSGEIFDICNTYWSTDRNYAMAQGAGNATNLAYQFAPSNFKVQQSNLIIPTGYFDSVHYLFQRGGGALLTWNSPLNRDNADKKEGYYTTIESRYYPGIYFDVYITETCEDTSLIGGGKQDSVTNYEFILNYAFVKQPISVTNETPFFKYSVYKS